MPSESSRALNVVFIGMMHEYSIAPLRALKQHHQVVGVIESLHPKWDYRHGSELARVAHRDRLNYHSMDRLRRPVEFLRRLRPDLIVVAGMAQRLELDEVATARLGAINLHPSLLPLYRGADPYFWQAREMDLQGGISVFQIDEQIDTGDLLAQQSFPITLGEPFDQIVRQSLDVGIPELLATVNRLAAGPVETRPQRHLPCPLVARPATFDDWKIDWQAWPIERIWHFLRAAPRQNPFIPRPEGSSDWIVGDMEHVRCKVAPGSCATDEHGPFLAHADGKIRVYARPKASLPRRIWRRIRRQVFSIRSNA